MDPYDFDVLVQGDSSHRFRREGRKFGAWLKAETFRLLTEAEAAVSLTDHFASEPSTRHWPR